MQTVSWLFRWAPLLTWHWISCLMRTRKRTEFTIDTLNLGSHCMYTQKHSCIELKGSNMGLLLPIERSTGTCLCFLSAQALLRMHYPCCFNGISAMWLHTCSISSAAQWRNCFYVSEIPTLPPHKVTDQWVCSFVMCMNEGMCIRNKEFVGCGRVQTCDGMCLFLIPWEGGHFVSKWPNYKPIKIHTSTGFTTTKTPTVTEIKRKFEVEQTNSRSKPQSSWTFLCCLSMSMSMPANWIKIVQ